MASLLQRLVDKIDPQEGRYRMLFERSPLPMWVVDTKTLGFLAVNDAALRLYEYSREEFLAMTALDIRRPEDDAAFRQFLSGEGGEVHYGAFRHMKKTGERIEAVQDQLKETDLSPAKRAELERKLSDLQSAQVVMDALAKGDWDALKSLETNEQAKQAIEEAKSKAKADAAKANVQGSRTSIASAILPNCSWNIATSSAAMMSAIAPSARYDLRALPLL